MTTTTAYPPRSYDSLGFIWRSLVVGLSYVVFSVVGGFLDQLFRLPLPAIANQIDFTQFLAGTLVAGIVMGFALGPLTTRLAVPTFHRTCVLFLLVYGIMTISIVMEGVFFTTIVTADQLYRPSTLVVSLMLAGTIAWLYHPAGLVRSFWLRLAETLARRSWLDWTWRVIAAGLLYVPTYLLFGMLIAPIVVPYYNNPSLDLGLVIPSFQVMLPLEVVRGLLFVVIVFPLIAILRGTRWTLAFWIGLTIAVLGGWVPMLRGVQLPLLLRVVHGLEITADSFVQGLTIAWLLGVVHLPPKSR